jgi:pimeloyl-ACP methyl ester carboxylesterase
MKQKQTVILLHGLFGRLSNWEHVIAHFQDDLDIHVPSLAIYDGPHQDILDYLVTDLDNYIRTLGLENVILIGNSLGGHVAILYAYSYFSNVKGLVLTGSSGLYENYAIGAFPRRHDYLYIKEKVSNTFFDPVIATKELVDDVFEIVGDNARCVRIMKAAKATQRNYVTELLPGLKSKVLLIWGIEDTITPPVVAEEFKRLIPDVELVYIENCGHAPMMERPEEFNAILARFITGFAR